MNLDALPGWLTYVAALVLLCSPVVFVLQWLAHRWLEDSVKTPSPYDDRVAGVAVKVLDAVCAVVLALPRVTMNLGKLLDLVKAARALPRPPSALLVLLVASLAVSSSACATTQEARINRAQRAVGGGLAAMQIVDNTFAPRLRAARLRLEAGDVPAEEREAFQRRWMAAGISVVSAIASLHTAEIRLADIEAGRGDPNDVGDIMACVAAAFSGVIDRLPTVGVDLPDEVQDVIQLAVLFAGMGGRCGPDDHAVVSGDPMTLGEAMSP